MSEVRWPNNSAREEQNMLTSGSTRSTEDSEALGRKLGEVRKCLGFSQAEVAGHLGITSNALSEIGGGRRRVDAIELGRLANLYGLEVGYFTEQALGGAVPMPDIVHLARRAANVSERDCEELTRFAAYLRARSRQGAKRP